MEKKLFNYLYIIFASYLILLILYVPVYGQSIDFFNFEEDLGSDWINCGVINWNIDPIQRDNSNFSLKSGEMRCANQSSCVSREVQGPVEISFWWMKSSYMYFLTDFSFSIDGITQGVCNEPSIWEKKYYSICDNNKHEIKWVFKLMPYGERDRIINCYPKAKPSGWIDDISLKYSQAYYSHNLTIPFISNNTILAKPDNVNEIIKNSRGKNILLERGIYPNLAIQSSNISLICQENGGALLDGKGGIGISIENASNVKIQGLTIFNSSIGVLLYNSTGSRITENKIDFSDNAGIYVENSSNNTIDLNDLICASNGSSNAGIRLIKSNNNTILDNYIHDFFSHDPYISGHIYLLEESYNNIIYNREYGSIYDNEFECQLHASRPERNGLSGSNTIL